MSDTNDNLPKAPQGHPDPKVYFKFRRETMQRTQWQMAVMTLIFTTIESLKPGTLVGLGSVVVSFYTAFSIPTIGYYSNTAIEEYLKRK